MTKGCLQQPITKLHTSTRLGKLLLLSCCLVSAEQWEQGHNLLYRPIPCFSLECHAWFPVKPSPAVPFKLWATAKFISCMLSLTGTVWRKSVSADGNRLELSPPQCKALEYWPLEGGGNEKVKWFNGIIWRVKYTQLYDIVELTHSLALTRSYLLFMFFTVRDFPGTLPLPAAQLLVLQLSSLRSLGACCLYTLLAPFAKIISPQPFTAAQHQLRPQEPQEPM